MPGRIRNRRRNRKRAHVVDLSLLDVLNGNSLIFRIGKSVGTSGCNRRVSRQDRALNAGNTSEGLRLPRNDDGIRTQIGGGLP